MERCYSSYLNQFIQPDTIIPDPGNSADWNRYAYVNYNPINFNDPTGHFPGQPPIDDTPIIDDEWERRKNPPIPTYYKNGLSEAELASARIPSTGQVGNSCSKHSVAQIYNIEGGYSINGNQLAALSDFMWLVGHFSVLPDNAAFPHHSEEFITFLHDEMGYLADQDLFTDIGIYRNDDGDLLQYLSEDHSYLIMTFYYRGTLRYYNSGKVWNSTWDGIGGAHQMLLVANDQTKQANGTVFEWGFVNSWESDSADSLFWFSTEQLSQFLWLPSVYVKFGE